MTREPDADWVRVALDTHDVDDKAALMDRLAETFDLPAWFGRNWDALADCLTDVRTEPGLVVTWTGADSLPRDLRRPLEDILEERAASGPTPVRLVRPDV